MASNAKWETRSTVVAALLSLFLGVLGTCAAYLQENHFRSSEMSNAWLQGIVINSALAGLFIVPIGLIVGRAIQRRSTTRGERNGTESAGHLESQDEESVRSFDTDR